MKFLRIKGDKKFILQFFCKNFVKSMFLLLNYTITKRYFHEIFARWISPRMQHYENYGDSFLRLFGKNFVKASHLLNKLPHCGKVLENAIILKHFPWNQLLSNFFSKTLIWRKKMLIFHKNRDRVLWYFSTLWLLKEVDLTGKVLMRE